MTLSEYLMDNLEFLGVEASDDNKNIVKYFLDSELEKLLGRDVVEKQVFSVTKNLTKFSEIELNIPDNITYTFSKNECGDLILKENKDKVVFTLSIRNDFISCTSYDTINSGYKKEIRKGVNQEYSLIIFDAANNEYDTYMLSSLNTKIGNRECFEIKTPNNELAEEDSLLLRIYKKLTEGNVRSIRVNKDDNISFYCKEIFDELEKEAAKDKPLKRTLS